ncbi:MAG: hypothetical protein R3195_01740 [Gemmatimonadota bacterium]|nr:hypothetical protein [Gemmatimonadota bacterium]
MTWTPWALPGIFSALFAGAAAIVLLRTAGEQSVNRRLASILALEAIWMAGEIFFMIESRTAFMVVAAISVGAMAALPFQYLSFLGTALDSRLVRPFGTRPAFWMLNALSALAALALLLYPTVFIGELYSPLWATWNFQFTEWGSRLNLFHGGASLFGLAVALNAYATAEPRTAARDRARWFSMAFGVRDLVAVSLYLFPSILRPIPFWGDFLYNELNALTNILYVALLSYGVLRHQLFDIDLKLKFVIRQSTIGGFIAGTFMVVSETLESLVPAEGFVMSLLSATVIVGLLQPVQRFAERFASRVMKGVEDTPEYLDRQKRHVYRAMLEGTYRDGGVTERERAILDRLRVELGIPASVAASLEAEIG